MALTLSDAPLSSHPRDTVNYRIDGPRHRLLFAPFPRRVRAVFGGQTVLDTTEGMLLHESNLLPQLYLPRGDVRDDLLTPTDHSTHCPFKGDASYWSVTVNGQTADNAVWSYLQPLPAAGWLRDQVAPYWGSMDAWFDEDEEVAGHLRDPYHRVDVRSTSRHVRVVAGDEVIAQSRRAVLLSETALPNRFYLPADDVRTGLLELCRVGGTHCCVPPPSEPYVPLIAAYGSSKPAKRFRYAEVPGPCLRRSPGDNSARVRGGTCPACLSIRGRPGFAW